MWHLNRTELVLRIPWAMAGLSDPSSHQALIPLGMFRATSLTIPGIDLTVTDAGNGGATQRVGTVTWHNWQAVTSDRNPCTDPAIYGSE